MIVPRQFHLASYLFNSQLNRRILFVVFGLLFSPSVFAAYIPFNTNVPANIGIGTSKPQGALTVMSGNVGIGTWVPGAALDVNGNINSAGNIRAQQELGLSAGYYFFFGNTYNSMVGGTTNGLQFYANSNSTTERMRLDVNGNLGIGTVNPVASLDVEGTLYPTVFYGSGTNYNVGVGSYHPGQALDVVGTVRATNFIGNGSGLTGVGSNWTYSSSGNVGLSTTANVGIGTSFTSGGAALTVMNGNVGIGTWAPSAAFQVKGSSQNFYISPTGNIGIGTSTPVAQLIIGITPTAASNMNVGIAPPNYTGTGSYATVVVSGNSNPSAPNSQYNVGLRGGIESFGSSNFTGDPGFVGILGETYYGGSATVTGAAKFEATDDGGGGAITNQYGYHSADLTSGTNNYGFYSQVSIGNSKYGFYAAGTAKNYFNGNVGIGSLAPGQALDVQGTVRATNFIGNGSGLTGINASNYWLNDSGNVGISTIYAVGIGTSFVGGTGEAALSVMNGNVGIGTWTPGNLLEVGPQEFDVTSAGNVGIGTLEPTTLLSVGPFAAGDIATPVGVAVAGDLTNTSTYSTEMEVDGYARPTSNSAQEYMAIAGAAVINNNKNLTLAYGLVGIHSFVQNAGTGTVSGAADLVAGGGLNSGGGTISNLYGMYILDQTVGTNNYGIYSIVSSGVNKWNFYVSGTANNYFAGNVGIGSLTPGQILDVQGTVRATNFVGNGSGLTGITATSNWIYTSSGNIGLNTTTNVGIGTSFIGGAGEGALSVMNGNVGIGTWVPRGSLDVEGTLSVVTFGGNVGIGTWAPGALLNVGGGAPTTAVNGIQFGNDSSADLYRSGTGVIKSDGSLIAQGYVDAANGSAYGIAIGNSAGQINTNPSGNNLILQAASGNVGIGTITPMGGLTIMNGNVGIGTWVPNGSLIVKTGNVGIGSITPGQMLDVTGTVRATNFVGNGSGLTGISATSNWIYTSSGNIGLNTTTNVGIGTSFVGGTGEGALSVMNGNVGIGTWLPRGALDVEGTLSVSIFGGNVGIGTWAPTSALQVNGDIRGNNIYLGSYANLYGTYGLIYDGNQNSFWGVSGYTSGGGGGPGLFFSQFGLVNTLSLSETGGADFNIISTGNVGIGTINPFGGGLIVTNGNVGIGSLTPGQILDVKGTVRATHFFGDGSGLTGITATSNWLYSSSGNIGLNTTTNVGIGTSFVGGAGEGALSVMNGNVGIGTWVPSQQLHIASSSPFINIQNSTSSVGFGGIRLSTSNNNQAAEWAINNNIASLFEVMNSSNTTQFVVDRGGNVGIGTLTPVNGLSVMNGNVGIGTWVPAASLQVVSPGSASATSIQTTGGIQVGSAGMYIDPNAHAIYYSSSSNGGLVLSYNGNTQSVAVESGSSTGNVDLISAGVDMRLTGAGNVGIGTTTPMGGLAVMNGNVGIGTWLPGALLDVGENQLNNFQVNSVGNIVRINGEVVSLTYSGFTTASPSVIFGSSNAVAGNFATFVGGASTAPSAIIQSTSVASGATKDNIEFLLGNNGGTTAMIIQDNSGTANIGIGTLSPVNVGIGTITPQGALVVTSGNVGIGTWVPNGSLIVKTGNVGIGSITPGQMLDVTGTVRATSFVGNGSGLTGISAASNWIYTSSGNIGLNTTTNVGIGTSFIGGAGEGALTVMNGNVGIGTWLPVYPLQITTNNAFGIDTNASIYSDSNVYGVTFFDATNGAYYVSPSGTAGYSALFAKNVGIGTTTPVGGLAVMNGNVGIGTWVPSSLLQVGSAAGGNDVIIDNAGNLTTGGQVVPGTFLTLSNSFGAVRFNDGSGALLGGNNNNNTLEISATTGNINVGINTGAPTGILEIEGGNVGIGTWVIPSGGSNNLVVWGNAGIGTTKVGGSGEAALSVMIGNVGIGTWVPNGALVVKTGNVGIGSNSPGQALDVQGSIRATNFVGNGSGLTGITATSNWLYSSSGNIGLSTTAAVGIGTSFVGSGSNAALAVMNGNVGIGTWAPSNLLQVGAGAGFQVSSSGSINCITGNCNVSITSTSVEPENSGTVNFGNGAGTASGSNTLLFGSNAVNSYLTLESVFNNVGTSDYINFLTGSQKEAMRITTSGNVGIGSWGANTPNNTLSVVGNIGIGTNQSSSYLQTAAPNGGLIVQGNVGIGTWAPVRPLQVSTGSNGIVGEFDGADSSGIAVRVGINDTASVNTGFELDMGGTKKWTAASYKPTGSNFSFVFYNEQTTTNSMFINGDTDNVGLGTIIPGSKLSVLGGESVGSYATNAAPIGGLIASGNVGIGTTTPMGGLAVMNGNVGVGTWVPAAGIDIETSGSSYFGGNVGFGTSVPGGTLAVQTAVSHVGRPTCWAANGAIGYCGGTINGSGVCGCTAL